ncbi:hypothetical protein [Halalkalibacter urbisdiaboli]|uniref:hypothetical protein n=1 Tax=Halalkalibacter urbisdiaboli TaxID=1960589 RepID=UPI000B44067E|nr:hypothetical protein [Halalkalibacter urbisdiaboli]
MKQIINKAGMRKDGTTYEQYEENGSILHYGGFEGTNHHFYVDGNELHLRLPWGRLNVTDPSSHQVLDDPRAVESGERDLLQTTTTDGIRLSAVLVSGQNEVLDLFPGGQQFTEPEPYLWSKWEQPSYVERLKNSYPYIQEYFKTLQ